MKPSLEMLLVILVMAAAVLCTVIYILTGWSSDIQELYR